MKRVTLAAPLFVVAALLATASPKSAQADPASEAFIKTRYAELTAVLKQPASPTREAAITRELTAMVDYDALVKRAFGEPCAATIASCTNHWAALSDAQKTEVRDLMRQLVDKSYRKNLTKTLDYEMTVRRSTDAAGESRVRTQVKSLTHPREAPMSVDYLVVSPGGNAKVVDIYSEGSSLTKNYYVAFHELLTTPAKGYPFVVRRLRELLAER
jgi:ABC-type transporter MlaC component